MLYQARMSGRGIRGIVTDGDTGEPLYATISIPEIGKDVYTDPDVGDYHRMVETGTYTVVCNADGLPTQTVYNVSASLDTFVVVNFAYEPRRGGPSAATCATPTRIRSRRPSRSPTSEGSPTTADAGTGYYEIAYVPVGAHDVLASLPGYTSDGATGIVVTDGTTSTVDFSLEEAYFFDDIESGPRSGPARGA